MKKSQLRSLIKQWFLEDSQKSDLLETEYFQINEIEIDELNSYQYQETQTPNIPGDNKAWQFEDRCGNTIVCVCVSSIGEFKSGYKVKEIPTLIFEPKKIPNIEKYIRICPDNKRVNTIYKILVNEVVPKYLLNKKPNKLVFNPVSDSRNRLTSIMLNKILKIYPQLIEKDNYLIYK